jgi:hypothetical protein
MIDKSLDEAGIHLFHYDRLSEFQAEEPPNPPKKPEIP